MELNQNTRLFLHWVLVVLYLLVGASGFLMTRGFWPTAPHPLIGLFGGGLIVLFEFYLIQEQRGKGFLLLLFCVGAIIMGLLGHLDVLTKALHQALVWPLLAAGLIWHLRLRVVPSQAS
jgi:hypothetical protein